ncbi:MFS transporter [Streptomyces sp. NPDC094448]|uniref:MFS transporter n=1 Tax=Streptomyces sp. NPDC094448 TaxID=3366063 RepID=UPI003804CAD7
MLTGLTARIPVAAAATALTLHVVLGLHRGYGAAGAVVGAYVLGVATASPLLGRQADRNGPRIVVAVTAAASLAFWTTAPLLTWHQLLAAAAGAGAAQVPVTTVVRRHLSTTIPPHLRRPGFALDSMGVEISFMAGPALAITLATGPLGTSTTLRGVGAATAVAAGALLLSLPNTTSRTNTSQPPLPQRWPHLWSLLVLAGATAMVATGTEIAIVALLRTHGQAPLAAVVIALWCCASLAGGFLYGILPTPPPLTALAASLGALTVLAGAGGQWYTLALLLIPAGLVYAPTVTSTLDVLTRHVPAADLGRSLGYHSAAMTLGNAMGAPLSGLALDHGSPACAFAAIGSAAMLGALPWTLRRFSASRAAVDDA